MQLNIVLSSQMIPPFKKQIADINAAKSQQWHKITHISGALDSKQCSRDLRKLPQSHLTLLWTNFLSHVPCYWTISSTNHAIAIDNTCHSGQSVIQCHLVSHARVNEQPHTHYHYTLPYQTVPLIHLHSLLPHTYSIYLNSWIMHVCFK